VSFHLMQDALDSRIQYWSLLTIRTNWIKANYIGKLDNNCLHGHARICL